MTHRNARLLVAALLFLIGAGALRASDPPISIQVDAGDAPRKIFHAHLTIPVKPGPITLVYPKWIPGEHGPTGPIADVAGLRFTVSGKPVQWRRDPVDMYAFHVDVPQGGFSLEVVLDYLSPAEVSGFSSGASATAHMAVISWNQLLLYPEGHTAADVTFAPSLRLPSGWKFGTALPIAKNSGAEVEFQPASLERLVDSPVIMGAFYRAVPLAQGITPLHEIDMAADSAAALTLSPDQQRGYDRLVSEAGSLFGARHYRDYHFLLSLSDHVAHFGLEHHESSDDRVAERGLIEPDRFLLMGDLLTHEFVHSWNGKYRRPAGLATSDFQKPVQGDLLWVYEGLTQYLGVVLAARSGLWSPEHSRDYIAAVAAALDYRSGRKWRPLSDTTDAAQLLYEARSDWADWRRGTDFYDESLLIWLEADMVIRGRTQGARSLDDFCRSFYGAPSGGPEVKPYTLDDVVAALNAIAEYDWRGFFQERVYSITEHAPLEGLHASGWRIAYTEEMSDWTRAVEKSRRFVDFSFSLGIKISEGDGQGQSGAIIDVIPELPAAKSGIAPGMKVISVNGRQYSPEILHEALRAARSGSGELELIVENTDFVKTYSIAYRDGDRYPHLERDASRPDALSKIFQPLTSAR